MALKDKLMTLEDFKAVRDVDVASNSAQFTEIKADLGIKGNLDTTDKSNIVNALNEVYGLFTAPTSEAVADWLDEHPEATTTVQDRSLTYAKLVTGTLGFATPEMFGAKGDGVTDDTTAVQEAFDFGLPVIMSGKYKIGSVTIRKPIVIDGYGDSEINSSEPIMVRSDDIFMNGLNIYSDEHNTLLSIGSESVPVKNVSLSGLHLFYDNPVGTEICMALDYANQVTVKECVFDVGGIDVRHSKGFVFNGNTHNGQYINDNECIHTSVYSENGVIENSKFLNLAMEAIDTFSSGNHIRISKNTFDGFQKTVICIKVSLQDSPYTGGSSDQPEYGYTEFINISDNVIRNFIPVVSNGNVNILEYQFHDYRSDKTHDNTKFMDYVVINGNIFDNMYPQDNPQATNVVYCCINVLGSGTAISGNTFSGLYANTNNYYICAIKVGTERTEAELVNTTQYNVIANNIISSQRSGILVSDSEFTTITGNIIRKDERYGTVCRYPIYVVKNPKKLILSNNQLYAANNGMGIQVGDGSLSDAVINGNVFDGDQGSKGILIYTAEYCNISDNYFYDTDITLGKTTNAGKLNVLSNNTFHGNDTKTYAVIAYNQEGLSINGGVASDYNTFVRLLNDCKYCLIANVITKDVSTFKNISSVTTGYEGTIEDVNNISYSTS